MSRYLSTLCCSILVASLATALDDEPVIDRVEVIGVRIDLAYALDSVPRRSRWLFSAGSRNGF